MLIGAVMAGAVHDFVILTASVLPVWILLSPRDYLSSIMKISVIALLATIALAIGTSFIINRGRAKYAWVTILPMTFVGITTLTAAVLNIKNIYIPQLGVTETLVPELINLLLTVCIIVSVIIIFVNAIPGWVRLRV